MDNDTKRNEVISYINKHPNASKIYKLKGDLQSFVTMVKVEWKYQCLYVII